jgi:hypothetical protein
VAAPAWATKLTHEPLRERYKTGLLAIQYGIGAETLAGRLGVSTFEASEMIAQHRELFAVYWRWAEDWLAHALDSGVMWTPLDWQCRTGITEFNQRSVINFPVQASASDALRVAIVMADRQGLTLLGPVHDALLLEAPVGADRGGRRPAARDHAAGLAGGAQRNRRQCAGAPHRREVRPPPGSLHRPPRRCDLGWRPPAVG